ncbi:hypothetical protein DUNSADRAFT_3377 [Dunaliella salina]|uniref:Inositol polyphosphate-related phosphatase domain-containing protein n=1 Tax=Dunaliella salina TaxID=3046 RepID=A0ABQ7GU39_DUNSA|nr:hypothetical protein DUNSADRAFT_3377 [Dunaliella salina]|eukprot:KAF5838127.1 hypothetical protein DUNSADRAFT_3377 [Dunaliella salina]
MRATLSKAWNGANSVVQTAQTYLPGYHVRQGAEDPTDEKLYAEKAEGINGKDDRSSDPVLENLIRDVKSKHVRKHFFSNPPKAYTESKDVRILTGSYNVAGHGPNPDLDLKPWIGMWDGQWPTVQYPPEAPSDPSSDTQAAAAPQLTQEGKAEEGADRSAGPPAVLHRSTGPGRMPPVLEASPSMDVQLMHEVWAARAATADVVALGFQEIVPLSAGNIVVGSDTSNVDSWDSLICRHLNGEGSERNFLSRSSSSSSSSSGSSSSSSSSFSRRPVETQHLDDDHQASTQRAPGQRAGALNAYVQVASKQLVGLYLTIWVRAELLPHIKGVQATQVATGFGGYLGNKGVCIQCVYACC